MVISDGCTKIRSFGERITQNTLGTSGEGKMTQGHSAAGGLHHILDHDPHLVQVRAKLFKHSRTKACAFADNPKKKVF